MCACQPRVRVKIIGGEGKPAPGQLESKEVLKHKKNPDVGTKTTYYADEIFVEQADAATFNPDEEVRSRLRGPSLFPSCSPFWLSSEPGVRAMWRVSPLLIAKCVLHPSPCADHPDGLGQRDRAQDLARRRRRRTGRIARDGTAPRRRLQKDQEEGDVDRGAVRGDAGHVARLRLPHYEEEARGG